MQDIMIENYKLWVSTLVTPVLQPLHAGNFNINLCCVVNKYVINSVYF